MKAIKRDDFEGFDIHKKFNVIVDILYSEGNFELGGKLNSVFGQYGIGDSDSFLDLINKAFNALLIKIDEENLKEEIKYNFIFSGLKNVSLLKKDLLKNNQIKNNEDDFDAGASDNYENEEEDEDEDEEEEEEDYEENDENYIKNESDIYMQDVNGQNDESVQFQNNEKHDNFGLNKVFQFNISDDLNKFYELAEFSENDFFKNNETSLFVLKNSFDNTFPMDSNLETYSYNSESELNNSSLNYEDFNETVYSDVDEDTLTFFVPSILICYRKEKKADFFIYNPFHKKSFVNLWKLNTISYFFILNNYKDFFLNLKNFYNIKKYMLHLNIFKKFFFGGNFLNSLAHYSQIPSTEKVLETYYDFDFNLYFMFRGKKKRRRKIFRSYYLKKKKQIAYFLKSFKWFSYEVLFKFFMFKYVFFDLPIDYTELKKKILTVYSIAFSFKKKFMKKYRRRKSFKRKVFRNKFGIKMSFIRQQFFDKKKKKKK